MINVTKTFLPPFEEYIRVLKKAWDISWVTNNGKLLQELETRLKEYLGVTNLMFCGNGTIVLQMALKALNITKEVITTPFSYVATANAILWEGCKPVFVDIDPVTLCIDANKIEAAITQDTQAILATHVYGKPCDVERIKVIAAKHGLKVIYDAAHSFGVNYNGKSLLSYGDISTCSFHATKVFHTVEGGCIICQDDELAKKLFLYRSFGHLADDYFSIGINGKNSEFHAAMGLVNLNYLAEIIKKRRALSNYYDEKLRGLSIEIPVVPPGVEYNYAYYPVIFKSESQLLKAIKILNEMSIFPRRYFFPSLNTLPFMDSSDHCPHSESISKRVICLPLFHDLELKDIDSIAEVLQNTEVR